MAREYTRKEFLQYKSHVNKWLTRLGLSHCWNVDYRHRTIADGVAGNATYDTVRRNVCFQLAEVQTGDYCLQDDMELLALHEVLHLLVSDLVWAAKETRDDVCDLVISREHELINRLLPVLLGRKG